ncbi:unnamed protein product [Calypogeia fissa]
MGVEKQVLGVGGGGMRRIGIGLLLVLLSLQASEVLSQGGQLLTFPAETEALLVFRKSLNDPQNNLQTWVSTSDPCLTWTAVFCDVSTQQGSTTYKHVTELRLLNMGLSGQLVPDLGNLTYLSTLDVMWNQLTGSIPSTLGNLAVLKILALNGNQLTGIIPPELGKLSIMNRIQLDQNQLSGPVPTTFGNLTALAHLHLNNNSLSGPVPKELGQCPNLIHILLDSNQLTGPMPPEIANATTLTIIQLDNNQLGGSIPQNYTAELTSLSKLSCRNCSLVGQVPDLSKLEHLYFVDFSYNSLTGPIPPINTGNITTIDFSHNGLQYGLPSSLLVAPPALQSLQLSFNNLNGSIPDLIQGRAFASDDQLLLDFQNNSFEYVSLGMVTDAINQVQEIDLRLSGNKDICTYGSQFITPINALCQPVLTTTFESYGNIDELPRGGPIVVTYRLKSPSFTVFTTVYEVNFAQYLAAGLHLQPEQVSVQSYEWQPGPRLLMIILINPPANAKFNMTEVNRIETLLANWDASNSTLFGPYELLGFVFLGKVSKKLSIGAIIGIVIGSIALLLVAILLVAFFILRKKGKAVTPGARRRALLLASRASQQSLLKITGVCAFSYKEMAQATDNFSETKEVGRGGYGKVYRGVLDSGQVVAIKRANLDAIQRNTEFYNEIELLSRCHHRNLVALVGYCYDEEEQMLVYEFMEGGTLHQHLHADAKDSLSFSTRLKIALGSAKGILYLHTEANPPIFHRDIKSNNILLDIRKQAKVADFGLSRLAPDFQDDLGDETQDSHISTVVKGTPGYLDPEYFLTRKLTDKSDVYSFGVVLLELITGMQPISYGKNIVREVRASFDEGAMWKVIDENMGSYPSEVMDPFVTLAMSCVDDDTNARPTMKEVTRTLERLLLNAQGKGFGGALSMDIQSTDFSVQTDKEGKLHSKGGFPSSDTGFDTGGTSATTVSPGSSRLFTPSYSRFYRIDAAPLQRGLSMF